MNIVILNGSPKKQDSVTMEFMGWFESRLPGHNWTRVNVAPDIVKYERSVPLFVEIMSTIAAADVLVWATPVYTFNVPAQLKRFIELVFERGFAHAFEGRQALAFVTSGGIYDHAVLAYLDAVSWDLNMPFHGGLSSHMMEGLEQSAMENMLLWWQRKLGEINEGIPPACNSFRFSPWGPVYNRHSDLKPVGEPTSSRLALLTDVRDQDTNLRAMIDDFKASFPGTVDEVHVSEMGGPNYCQGCVECMLTGHCRQKDGLEEIYNSRLADKDGLVIATTIRDRYIASSMKRYFDRMLYQGHNIILYKGKTLGFLLSGPATHVPEVGETLTNYVMFKSAESVHLVSDDESNPWTTTRRIQQMARYMDEDIRYGYRQVKTFPAVGASRMMKEFVFKKFGYLYMDHKHYMANKLYDFPLLDMQEVAKNLAMAQVMKVDRFRKLASKRLTSAMLAPLRKALAADSRLEQSDSGEKE